MTSNEQYIDRFYKGSGRSSRSMFWTTILVAYAIFFFGMFLGSSLGGNIGGLFVWVSGLASVYILFCNNVRRMHDLGYSGWVWFAAIAVCATLGTMMDGTTFSVFLEVFVSLVNFIILGCVSGEKYKNKYGHPVVHSNSSTMQHAYSS